MNRVKNGSTWTEIAAALKEGVTTMEDEVMSKTNVEDKKPTAPALTEALKRHGIGTSVGEVTVQNFTCRFCGRDDFKSAIGLGVHAHSCLMNPSRKAIATAKCPRCNLNVSKRGFDAHVDACNGDPDVTIRRRALRDDAKRRKAEARIAGIDYDVTRDKRSSSDVEYKITSSGDVIAKVLPKSTKISSDKKVDIVDKPVLSFDTLVSMMTEHCAPSMGRCYKEFLEWVEKSKNLWDSV